MLQTILDYAMKIHLLVDFKSVLLVAAVFLAIGSRRTAGFAISLLFFTIAYNVFLKQFFQVPPVYDFPGIKYALPSGHTHVIFVFYGWLLLNINRFSMALRFALLTILGALVAASMVYNKYHVFWDVFAALVFGAVTLAFASWLKEREIIKKQPMLFPLTFLALTCVCLFLTSNISIYLWHQFTAFCAFVVGFSMCQKSLLKGAPSNYFKKIMILFGFAIYVVFLAFLTLKFSHGVTGYILWGLLGFGFPVVITALQEKL